MREESGKVANNTPTALTYNLGEARVMRDIIGSAAWGISVGLQCMGSKITYFEWDTQI